MTPAKAASIHGSAVSVGDRAVLIRGPSGSGKSSLAFDLILAGRSGQIPPTMLVGDDRVNLEVRQGALIVRPARELAGLIEIRGLGIRHCDFAAQAMVGLIIDLLAPDAERLPPAETLQTQIEGVIIPRVPVSAGESAFRLAVAALTTRDAQPFDNCPKEFGNHISPTIATE